MIYKLSIGLTTEYLSEIYRDQLKHSDKRKEVLRAEQSKSCAA